MELILYLRSEDVPVGTYLLLCLVLDSEYNLTVARDGIVHLATVEANQAEFTIQFLVLQEEETGKNLDGIGALLVDVIARVTAVESLQGSFHEEIAGRSLFAIEVEGSLGGLTACA